MCQRLPRLSGGQLPVDTMPTTPHLRAEAETSLTGRSADRTAATPNEEAEVGALMGRKDMFGTQPSAPDSRQRTRKPPDDVRARVAWAHDRSCQNCHKPLPWDASRISSRVNLQLSGPRGTSQAAPAAELYR